MVVLFLSILASIAVWTYLFSFKLAIALIVSVFIHEYGHFYWMGREGIKNKDMFFLPPFGAMARAKEPWTSYGSELRIALAGPATGLLSVLLFFGLWLIYPNNILLASVALACIINLFNLVLPIAILDGGRVIKSILYSIHRTLGNMFYIVGFLFLCFIFVFGYLNPLFVVLIGYLLYQEWEYGIQARKRWNLLKKFRSFAKSGLSESGELESEFTRLNAMVNMKKMSWKEMLLGFFFFVGLILTYSTILYLVSGNIDLHKIQSYFQ